MAIDHEVPLSSPLPPISTYLTHHTARRPTPNYCDVGACKHVILCGDRKCEQHWVGSTTPTVSYICADCEDEQRLAEAAKQGKGSGAGAGAGAGGHSEGYACHS